MNADQTKLEEEPGNLWSMTSYLINRISHRYNHNVQAVLKAQGLTTLNGRIIVSLQVYGQLTVNELCVHAIAEQPTMSRALDRLEAEGLISRLVAENDSRARVVQLTAKGEAMCGDIKPVMRVANENLLEGLDPDEREQLRKLLTQVLRQIRKNPV